MRNMLPNFGEPNQVIEPANDWHLVLEARGLVLNAFIVFPEWPIKFQLKFLKNNFGKNLNSLFWLFLLIREFFILHCKKQ